MQDGRTLTCTPDHELLRADGQWVRADRLVVGKDRVVMGLEAPLDAVGADEADYVLAVGDFEFSMATAHDRLRTLAFARLLGHLLSDGSISVLGQGRVNVGQALDRDAVLDDIELLTGKRPAGSRYDDRKWSIALPMELTQAIMTLRGVQIGKRIDQPSTLPEFVLDERCPVAVVREFLGGLFGADGHSPGLCTVKAARSTTASLSRPAYSQSAKPEHVASLKQKIQHLIDLLVRCGVNAKGAKVYEYAVRRSASTYANAQDGVPRTEIRLELPEGLSFVERVGYRYCVDKQLRASAAAVYWRTIDMINRQRLTHGRPSRGDPSRPHRAAVLARASARRGRAHGRRDARVPALLAPRKPRSIRSAAERRAQVQADASAELRVPVAGPVVHPARRAQVVHR